MNKKQERIATVLLAAFLIAMFCYQVAYGTNEGSYNTDIIGDSLVITVQKQKIVKPPNSDNPTSEFCNVGEHTDVYKAISGMVVTITAACSRGYIDGWMDWCKIDLKDCLGYVLSGVFPDVYNQLRSTLASGSWTLYNTTSYQDQRNIFHTTVNARVNLVLSDLEKKWDRRY